MDNYLLVDPDNVVVWGSYSSEKRAERALLNYFERGHKLKRGMPDAETAERLVVISPAQFAELDVLVEVKNLMSGKPVMIRKSQRGGCTDPSTETYWSM